MLACIALHGVTAAMTQCPSNREAELELNFKANPGPSLFVSLELERTEK